ncbi:hypothetical protein IWW50_002594 [Coemansia erecta]|nr:hypothetical protein IWW50_002594 [Coemansia erecta]
MATNMCALQMAGVEHILILSSMSILAPASTYVLIMDTNLAALYVDKYKEWFMAAWAHHHLVGIKMLRLLVHMLPLVVHVVMHDKHESGMCGLLNFGHAIGHAIEALPLVLPAITSCAHTRQAARWCCNKTHPVFVVTSGIHNVYALCLPLYAVSCNYEHLVGKALVGSGSDSGEWPLIECNFIQLVQFVTGRDLNRVAMDGPSFFVSLIALSVAEFLPAKLETLITSAQTIKLHADLLLRSVEFAGKMLARAHDDNVLCQRFVQCHHSPNVPLIALNMGYAGQMSRVLCPYLTPVTHPLLTSAAAPGQISMREIHQARALLAVRWGCCIRTSLKEIATVDELLPVLENPAFGGASAMIPHKQTIVPLLDMLSLAGGRQHRLSAHRRLSVQTPAFTDYHVLFIGAGSTSRVAMYTLYTLCLQHVSNYNRTSAHAHALRDEFSHLFHELSVAETLESVLIEQGIHQMEMWTQSFASAWLMGDAVLFKVQL